MEELQSFTKTSVPKFNIGEAGNQKQAIVSGNEIKLYRPVEIEKRNMGQLKPSGQKYKMEDRMLPIQKRESLMQPSEEYDKIPMNFNKSIVPKELRSNDLPESNSRSFRLMQH